MAKRKLTEAEKAEWERQRAQTRANAQRTRELAERAFAKLDPEQQAKVRALAPGAPPADA